MLKDIKSYKKRWRNCLKWVYQGPTYPKWVASPVLVKKNNGDWIVSINLTDLNKACPKDSFPLLRIDQMVNVTARHELLSFIKAYSSYNQIPMYEGLYSYKMIQFGCKNVETAYLRLVNSVCPTDRQNHESLSRRMLLKITQVEDHIQHMSDMFVIIRKYKIKLDTLNCAFGVSSSKFWVTWWITRG